MFVFQAVQLGTRERLLAFCEAVQRSCPVGSFIKPIAGSSPGYASEVSLSQIIHSILFLDLMYIHTHYDTLLSQRNY